jgi:CBS domain-containing protein
VNWWFGGLYSKDETVKDAIDLLTRNKIISAPVYDDDANQYHSNSRHDCCLLLFTIWLCCSSRFIGFVDMLDLATLCVEHLSTAVRALSSLFIATSTKTTSPLQQGKPLTQEEFERLPICSVIDLSVRPQVTTVGSTIC